MLKFQKAVHGLERLFQFDSRLNDALYKRLTKNETEEFYSLVGKMSDIDTIEDIGPLQDFREQVSQGGRWYTRDDNVTNCYCYGIWKALFPMLDEEEAILYPSIEHGFFPEDIVSNETFKTARMTCATFSDYRKEIIRAKTNLPVFTVGPYIQYANSYYDQEKLAAEKSTLGKTLLFFVSHSVDAVSVSRNDELLINQLHELGADHSTIMISVFWWDICSPFVQRCKKEGFKVVSAGYLNDPMFLRRLRTIIELADDIYSDALGTHTSYCAALGNYCKMITCETSFSQQMRKRGAYIEEVIQQANSNMIEDELNEHALDTLRRYWGLGVYRNPEERMLIASISSDLFSLTNGHKRALPKAVSSLLKTYEKTQEYSKLLLLQEAVS